MFQVGDRVRYGQAGVCRVEEIRLMNLGGQEREYFVLTPLYRSGTVVYVPCENRELVDRMLPLLTPDQALEILAEVTEKETEWNRDFRSRSDEAKKALVSGDRREALFLIKNIYAHKRVLIGEGKYVHTTDDCYLRDAEELIFHEFSLVLGKEYREISDMVRKAFGHEEMKKGEASQEE